MFKYLVLISMLVTSLFSRDVIDNVSNCKINWTKGHITCTSESAEGQSKFAAKISAKVIARRDLLEVIKGVQITSDMTIKDGLIASDVISSRVDGVIKGAQIISNEYDKSTGSALATARIEMGEDLLKALLSDPTKLSWNEKLNQIFNNISIGTKLYADSLYTLQDKKTLEKLLSDLQKIGDAKGSEYVAFLLNEMKQSKFSGILIDVSELARFKKAMIVKLVDKNGKEIYPANRVSKSTLTKKNTSVGYMFGFEDARKNKRVFSTPLELKVSDVYKNKRSNIVLSDDQIAQINQLGDEVFKKAKIILVLGD